MKKLEKKPKMTVNKLGEYLIANPARQRRILEQLKYPLKNKFGAVAHSEAREAIKKYLINEFDENIINDCIGFLKDREGGSDHLKNMDRSSILMLKHILDSENLEHEKFNYEPYAGDNPKIFVQDVEVSIYPDIIVHSTARGINNVGALKIHLGKAVLTEEGGKYIAAILWKFTDEFIVDNNQSNKADHNISYDVFSDSFIGCPASVTKRWQVIEAGCKNIIAIWDSI